jgi:hypothetical protein
MNKAIIPIIILVALLGVGVYYVSSQPATPPEDDNEPVVGEPTQNVARITTRIDQGGSALGVTVTPLEVVQDSRCPADVVCIWEGTVRLRARMESGLGAADQIFELGKPITTEAEIVTLIEVMPEPAAGKTIPAKDYVFVFEIKKR